MNGYIINNIKKDPSGVKMKEDHETSIFYHDDTSNLFLTRHSGPSDEQTSVSSYSPVSSPDVSGCLSSPNLFNDDSQMSLVHKSEGLNIVDELSQLSSDDVLASWPHGTILENGGCGGEHGSETPAKIRRSSGDEDISQATVLSSPISNSGYDLSEAISSSQFIFTQFGKDNANVFTAGSQLVTEANATTTTSNTVSVRTSARVQTPVKKFKEPSLIQAFPNKHGRLGLEITVQPENHHRARYLTEGSRGAVKDQSGEGFPMVKLHGYNESCRLQVFVGQDTGKPRPHGFYQACKVSGKNSTPCTEREIEGITVIEMNLEPGDDMVARIDCVGILKLRNADVEHMVGITGKSKKKSTKARLVFRVIIPKPDGSCVTLQTTSIPILCTQPVGTPEICRWSISECPVTGNRDLFIIGKNFGKGIKVFFREKKDDAVLWQEQAAVESDFFQTTHLICKVPKYRSQSITDSVVVELLLHCAGKFSEPIQFTYSPVVQKTSTATIAECVQAAPSPENQVPQDFKTSAVSPEALELNRLIQQQVAATATTSAIFQIPAGVGISSTHNSTLESSTNSSSSATESRGEVTSMKPDPSMLPAAITHYSGAEVSSHSQVVSPQANTADVKPLAIHSPSAVTTCFTDDTHQLFLPPAHTPMDTHNSHGLFLDAPVKSVIQGHMTGVGMETTVDHSTSSLDAFNMDAPVNQPLLSMDPPLATAIRYAMASANPDMSVETSVNAVAMDTSIISTMNMGGIGSVTASSQQYMAAPALSNPQSATNVGAIVTPSEQYSETPVMALSLGNTQTGMNMDTNVTGATPSQQYSTVPTIPMSLGNTQTTMHMDTSVTDAVPSQHCVTVPAATLSLGNHETNTLVGDWSDPCGKPYSGVNRDVTEAADAGSQVLQSLPTISVEDVNAILQSSYVNTTPQAPGS